MCAIATEIDQIEIEEMYNRSNIAKVIVEDLEESQVLQYMICEVCSDIKNYYLESNFYESKQKRWDYLLNKCPVGLYNLVQELFISSLFKQHPQNIQAVIGRVAPVMEHEDYFDAIKTLSELCVFMAKRDLFDIKGANESETGFIQIIPRYQISEDTRSLFEFIGFLPPMIVKPRLVKSNFDYSYLTVKRSVLLQSTINHHEYPLALDVLNIANSIEWAIDSDVLTAIPERDLSNSLESMEAKKNYEIMCEASQQVYAIIYNFGNSFYLTHGYDKRGRLYSRGYQIHLQAAEYKRALMNFKHSEDITGVTW